MKNEMLGLKRRSCARACSIHAGTDAAMYCKDCRRYYCRSCATKHNAAHSTHDIVTVSAAMADALSNSSNGNNDNDNGERPMNLFCKDCIGNKKRNVIYAK